MYVPMVIALMAVFPIASILIEVSSAGTALEADVVGKWFVFRAVGVRLLVAGVRQIVQPRYTAEVILGLKAEESHFLIRELGFATTAIGSVAVASLGARGWAMPMAVTGAIFYGLAGVNHLLHRGRTRLQDVSMVSDLFAALVLLALCLAALRP